MSDFRRFNWSIKKFSFIKSEVNLKIKKKYQPFNIITEKKEIHVSVTSEI